MKTRQKDAASGFTLIEVIVTLVIVAVVGTMMISYFGTSITQSSVPIFRLKAAARLNDVLEKISVSYSQYPEWHKYKTYALNAVVLPSAKRTGLLYKITTAGTSGPDEPTWPITMGDSVTKDGVTYTTVWTSTTNGASPTLVLNGWLPGHAYTTNPVSIVYANGGNQYICTVGGTSGSSTPIWTISSSPLISDGSTVKWQWIGPAPTLVLQTAIGTENTDYDNTYGRYRVILNRFITFDKTNSPATEVYPVNLTDQDYGKYLKVTIGLHSGDADRTDETLTTLFVLR